MSLSSPPALAYPDFDRHFDVICDASGYSLGAILEQDGKVVYYASRTLNPAEKRYSATERELLAIVWATKVFKCYLLGRRFTVYTDHRALAGFMRTTDTTSRILRWVQKLSEFDFDIIYKPGKKNANADCLSRIPIGGQEGATDPTQIWVVTRKQLREKISALRDTHPDRNGNGTNGNETNSNDAGNVADVHRDKSKVRDIGVRDPGEESQNRIDLQSLPHFIDGETEKTEIIEVDDPQDIEIILKDHHDALLAGHFGAKRTLRKIREKYKWPGMTRAVKDYVKRCEKCQRNKHTRRTKMPMTLTGVAKLPFEKVYVDIVGPLPATENGNKYILSLMDDLTRFVDFVAMPSQDAETVAKILFEQILSRYTIPKKLVTD